MPRYRVYIGLEEAEIGDKVTYAIVDGIEAEVWLSTSTYVLEAEVDAETPEEARRKIEENLDKICMEVAGCFNCKNMKKIMKIEPV